MVKAKKYFAPKSFPSCEARVYRGARIQISELFSAIPKAVYNKARDWRSNTGEGILQGGDENAERTIHGKLSTPPASSGYR